jgi:hypothetical protein
MIALVIVKYAQEANIQTQVLVFVWNALEVNLSMTMVILQMIIKALDLARYARQVSTATRVL